MQNKKKGNVMSTDGLLKGAVIGAGAALVLLYLRKQKKESAARSAAAGRNSSLNEMSNEKLAEMKDSIEDILAERDAE